MFSLLSQKSRAVVIIAVLIARRESDEFMALEISFLIAMTLPVEITAFRSLGAFLDQRAFRAETKTILRVIAPQCASEASFLQHRPMLPSIAICFSSWVMIFSFSATLCPSPSGF